MSPAALSVRAVSKAFGATGVLHQVDLDVEPGRVHGLLGGNGSGKSTLIKILAGVHSADSGTVRHGEHTVPAADLTPRTAARLGLRFVHQDQAVLAGLSVAENLVLGRGYPRGRLGGIDWRLINTRAEVLLRRYGLDVNPARALATLSPPQRTMVAVARALHDAPEDSVLILDEPTATMPRAQAVELLALVRRLAEDGRAVVLVTHRISEVLEFTDALTCLRDGRVAESRPTSGLDHDDVVALITGDVAAASPARRSERHASPASASVSASSSAEGAESSVVARFALPDTRGHEAEITVRAGEIVGLAGLVGSGRSRILRGLYGLGEARDTRMAASPREAVRQGIAFVPEHRVADALFPDHSLVSNIVAARQRSYWRGLMRNSAQLRDASRAADECRVRAAGMRVPISSLSGGNQQKAVLARWLLSRPRLLLLDEPTQGVDVAGRAQIHDLVRAQVERGMAVIMTSSDFEEMAQMCDRVIVLAHGCAVAELSGADVTVERMTQGAHWTESVSSRRVA